MKKLNLFIYAFFFFFLTSNAQIEKGYWMLGGEARFYSTHSSQENGYDFPRSNGFSLSPNIGYFVVDNLAIGSKITFDITNSTTGVGIGPFARYYFLGSDKLLNVFVDARAGYGIAKHNDNTNKIYNSFFYGFKTGPVIFLNENIALELVLDYSVGKNIQQKIKYDNFYATIGLQIHLKDYNKKH